jgi:diacylglycerol kinase family enzyme
VEVRALLIANPCATSTTQVRRDVIAHALASEFDLESVETRYRGHAYHVARDATKAGYDLVLTLGGDGTVNEAVNGLLHASRNDPASAAPAPASAAPAPAFAALPGGNANVFARALGLPADPVDATGRILRALASGQSRLISLGLAGDRYFCFNAGLGIDAEVVRVVEGLRARGRAISTSLYLRVAVRQFYTVTDRRRAAIVLELEGRPETAGLFCGIVSNTSPWTYLGDRPVRTSPQASFDTGLDLFALRKLSTFTTLNAVRRMLGSGPSPGKHLIGLHDLAGFTLRSARPIAFQADGEYLGERECVTFSSVPNALRVIA